MARKFLCVLSVCFIVAAIALAAPDPMREYNDRVAKIDLKSSDAHYELAEWAFKNDLLPVARKELNAALELDKGNRKAALLLMQVEAAIKERGNTPATAASEPAVPVTVNGSISEMEKLLLSADDINHIKLAELNKNDDDVKVEFKNDVLNRYVKAMQNSSRFNEKKFRNSKPAEKAIEIRDSYRDDPAWLNDIVVKGDPKFMTDFKTKILPVLLQSCASTDCHGGDKANGGLRLFTLRNDRTDYTNYAIMDLAKLKSGKMINRDYRDDSILLEFIVAEDKSTKVKHPTKITPAFVNRNLPGYQNFEDWLKTLQPPPHPDYRLKYNPPFGMKFDVREPATQPVTATTKIGKS